MGLGALAGAAVSIGGSLLSSGAQTSAANKAADTQMAMYQQTRQDLSPFMSGGGQAFSNLANIFGFTPQGGAGAGATQTTGPVGTTVSPLGAPPGSGGQQFVVQNGQLVPASSISPLAAGTGGTPSSFPTATNGSPLATGGPNAGAAWQALTQFPGYQFGMDQGIQALDRSAASRGLLLSGAQLQDAQKFGADYAAQQAWQPYVSELNWAAGLGENAAAGAGNAGTAAAAGAAQSQLAAGQSQAAGITGVANTIGQLASSYGNIAGLGSGGSPLSGGLYSGGQDIPGISFNPILN